MSPRWFWRLHCLITGGHEGNPCVWCGARMTDCELAAKTETNKTEPEESAA